MPVAGSPGAPVGSGTTYTPSPNTDTGVCAISPSDLVGYTGNALNRIKDLEQKVKELEAKITQANQLSDLSQQVGWVGGVTYMGVDGWTQTEYGTLIPPPGVSFSSLGLNFGGTGIGTLPSPPQLMVVDADGNLIFGAGQSGIEGSQVDAWNGGGTADYAVYRSDGTDYNRNITTSFPNARDVRMTVSQSGVYWVAAKVSNGSTLNAGASLVPSNHAGDVSGNGWQDLSAIMNWRYTPSPFGLFPLDASGDYVDFIIPGSDALAAKHMYMIRLTGI